MALQTVPFALQAEDSDVPTTAGGTQIRDADNPEIVEAGKVLDDQNLRPGSTGTGYVDYGAGPQSLGDSVAFEFDLAGGGNFDLHFRYANGGATDRPLSLDVNGATVVVPAFAPTAGWSNWSVETITVPLQDGVNVVALTIEAASLTGPNLDALAVTEIGGAPDFTDSLAPTDIALSNATVAENAAGAVVGILTATDPDGDGITYAVDDPRFVVVGDLLQLAPGVSLNHEEAAQIALLVTATDSAGLSSSTTLAVAVSDVNEAPVITGAVPDLLVTAGTAATFDLAATLGATDPEVDAIAFAATGAGGGPLPEGITLSAGELQVAATIPLGSYALSVVASDGALSSAPVTFDVVASAEDASDIALQAETGAISLATGAGTITVVRDASNPESGLVDGLRPGYTGSGYVDFGDDAGDTLGFSVGVAEAGDYALGIRYASQDFAGAARSLDVIVNGVSATVPFPSTGPTSGPAAGFNVWETLTLTVPLSAGTNAIALAIPAGASGAPNVDAITISQGGDTSADEDGNLAIVGPATVPFTGVSSIEFAIAGLDPDIVLVEFSFDGGATRVQVTSDASGIFAVDGTSLGSGAQTATLFVTDDAGNSSSTSTAFSIAEPVSSSDFTATLQAETFDTADADGDTAPASLWPGFEGDGYLDMGNEVGDVALFSVPIPEAGTYEVTIRYALGAASRPMEFVAAGAAQGLDFFSTGAWDTWSTISVEVDLPAGLTAFELVNTIANGPNIDAVTVAQKSVPIERAEVRYEPVARINFEPVESGLPADYATPAGYLADSGAAYGARAGGLAYGWVTEASVADGTMNGTVPAAQPTGALGFDDEVAIASDLQRTSASFESSGAARAWELGVANGSYLMRASIGGASLEGGDLNVLNIEGAAAVPAWSPSSLGLAAPGAGYLSALVTHVAEVTDGALTIDSIGGTSTDIQWLEVERIPDLSPGDGVPASEDYSYFAAPVADSLEDGQVSITLGANGELPASIDPTSTLVVGVVLRGQDYRGPNIVHTGNVRLVETLTGQDVPIQVQVSGGSDSLNVRPIDDLDEFTSYTLRVEDVLDLGSFSNPSAPLRQMQDLTTTFVTDALPEPVQSDVSFDTTTLLDGFADGAGGFATVEIGPDGRLYVATITGEILSWEITAGGGIDPASAEVLSHPYFEAGAGERRGIIGLAFQPDDPGTIWISDNAPIPRESSSFSTPEFSGRISKITLGPSQSLETATIETYIAGLPRSGGDHLTNSLAFRANPDFGQPGEPQHLLYVSQGSNSAAGLEDPAWGGRPERLLSAAILEIDPTRDAPAGGFDVQTEPLSASGDPTSRQPLSEFAADGTYPGFYDPFAEDAVLSIYAGGTRNAYDLLWHSNGTLYVPTNGTAAGGQTPEDPTQPGVETAITNVPKQSDFLFTVDEGKYYGHPNSLRDQFVLNGGNPTAMADPFEVVDAADGNPTTNGYEVGVQPDPDYDLGGIYALGINKSPNGVTEYASGIFGADFEDAIVVTQFSVGDNIRVLDLDASGAIVGDEILRRANGTVIDNYIDPLDIIADPFSGNLYMVTLDRSTGASQLVLLTPTPDGAGADLTADADGDLSLALLHLDDATAVFEAGGIDADISQVRIALDGVLDASVAPDAQGRFAVNVAALPDGPAKVTMMVADENLNTASATLDITLGVPPVLGPVVTIQSEDRTPGDGTAVTVATGGGAGIEIRDALNPGTDGNPELQDGLFPGAFGIDGNTDNGDGVPGGYVDFGSSNEDFVSYAFESDFAMAAVLAIRYANGGGAPRPLDVAVNGSVVSTVSFAPTGSFAAWQVVEVPAALVAGTNVVTLQSIAATGPNVDQLEISGPVFFPNPAVVAGATRIEAEATDGSVYVSAPETAMFFFSVAEAGLYRLDAATTAGFAGTGSLTWTLDGTSYETSLPGAGTSGEEGIFAELAADTPYSLELSGAAELATGLDYLDIGPEAGAAGALIAIESLDPAYFDDRLHFSYLENPVQNTFERDYKEDGTVRIGNAGTAPLQFLDAALTGPFALASPAALEGLTLDPGASIDVEVLFDRSQYTPPTSNVDGTSTVFEGSLKLFTNDAETPTTVIDLAGFWQQTWENGQEPNVNEVWEVFGFGNRIDGLSLIDGGAGTALSTNDVYAQNDATEILSPYWKIVDGVTEASATQLAAYHGVTQAYLALHQPGGDKFADDVQLWNHTSADNQRILPNVVGSQTTFATATFGNDDIPDAWLGEDVFGIVMDGGSTDPRLNDVGGAIVPGTQQGHTVKMFQAYDAAGNALEHVYLGIMDYTGINYDFNDNMFIFEGIEPVGVGPTDPLAGSYPDPDGTPFSDIA